MLCDGLRSELSGRGRIHNHQHALWAMQGLSQIETAERMKRTQIVIVDLGGIGLTVTLALAAAGFMRITGIDHRTVTASDLELGYPTIDLGKLRADAVASRLNSSQCQRFQAVTQEVQYLSKWDELISEADLVIVCSDKMSLGAYEQTNQTCLRHKIRWVSARIDRLRGFVGPFIVPEQTACFTCFELRSRANSEHPSDHAALYRHWKSTSDMPEDWPVHPSFAAVLGNYLTLDIQLVLIGNQVSRFLGRILDVDFHALDCRFHEVLKLPRCPACSRSRSRPLTRIWDIRPTELSITGH